MAIQRDIRSVARPQSSPQARTPSINTPTGSATASGHGTEPYRELVTTSRISVSLSPSEYASLRAVAAAGQRSLGWVMRYALRNFMEGQPAQLEIPFDLKLDATEFGTQTNIARAFERLATMDWQRLRSRTSGTIHNLHPYPTRFAPEVPATIIELFSARRGTVLDPFCGSGTTLVETIRRGREAIGVDLSPLAILISRVKTTPISTQDRKAVQATTAHVTSLVLSFWGRSISFTDEVQVLDAIVREHCSNSGIDGPLSLPDQGTLYELSGWFDRNVLVEVLLIRAAIDQCPLAPAKDILTLALSAVLLQLSHQRSDTRRARVCREIKPSETHNLWRRKVVDLVQVLAREHETLQWSPVELHEGEARSLEFLQPCSVDLVITSCPYPNVYDYRASQRLRLLALGLKRSRPPSTDLGSPRKYWSKQRNEFRSTFKHEIGDVLVSLKHVLKPSGICAFVIGPSRILGEEEDNASSLQAAAADAGFRLLGSASLRRSSTTGSLHKRRASDGKGESIVVLQR